jgi:hypothetical protein
MSTQDEINSIERDVKVAQKVKDLGAALERLYSNRDFRTVIKSAYFEGEAVRLVHAKGDPSCQTPEKQASIVKQIDAISTLNQFFLTIQHQAGLALKQIEEGEAVLEELRAEELK